MLCLSKDIRCHEQLLPSQQLKSSKTAGKTTDAQVEWTISLVIADGHFNLLSNFYRLSYTLYHLRGLEPKKKMNFSHFIICGYPVS